MVELERAKCIFICVVAVQALKAGTLEPFCKPSCSAEKVNSGQQAIISLTRRVKITENSGAVIAEIERISTTRLVRLEVANENSIFASHSPRANRVPRRLRLTSALSATVWRLRCVRLPFGPSWNWPVPLWNRHTREPLRAGI